MINFLHGLLKFISFLYVTDNDMHINAFKDHMNGHMDGNFSVSQHAHRHVGWVTLSYEDMKDRDRK